MGRIDRLSLAGAFIRAITITAIAAKSSRYIPRQLKWFVVFILALNLRGFPLLWHIRHLRPWVLAILKEGVIHRTQGHHAKLKRLTALSPIGLHPLDVHETWKSRAGLADCDYNGHLSNSSYAKNLDYVRLQAAVRYFPGFCGHGVGGHIALAGTYYLFLKEIPLNAEYEIFLYFGGWEEQKWVYLTAAFVTRGKQGQGQKEDHNVSGGGGITKAKAGDRAKELVKAVLGGDANPNGSKSPQLEKSDLAGSLAGAEPHGIVKVPTIEVSSPTTTAVPLSPTSGSSSGTLTPDTPDPHEIATPTDEAEAQARHDALEALRIRIPSDATLNAVCVTQYCFKHGRVTVPPRVAFIASGFGDPARWERLMEVRKQEDGDEVMRRLMRGGWQDQDQARGGKGGFGEGFWDFKECEERGLRAGDKLKSMRFVLGSLGGEAR